MIDIHPGMAAEIPQVPGYDMGAAIGSGRVATVWEARSKSGEEVAIKLIPAISGITAERFLHEAKVLARFQHPRVVRCRAAGRTAEHLFAVLDLLPGDLRRRLAAGPLSEREAIRITRDAAEGLAELHRAGVIHRDLSPGNLLLTADGRCVIADCGLAGSGMLGLTRTGEVLGTPAYLAPEQARGQPATPASDLYALGALLYTMLVGSAPIQGHNAWTVIRTIAANPSPDLSRLPNSVSLSLRAVLRCCLTPAVAHRYAQATELIADLDAVIGGTPPTHAGRLRPPGEQQAVAIVSARRWPLYAASTALGLMLGWSAAWLAGSSARIAQRDLTLARQLNTPEAWANLQARWPAGPAGTEAQRMIALWNSVPDSVGDDPRSSLRSELAARLAQLERSRRAPAPERTPVSSSPSPMDQTREPTAQVEQATAPAQVTPMATSVEAPLVANPDLDQKTIDLSLRRTTALSQAGKNTAISPGVLFRAPYTAARQLSVLASPTHSGRLVAWNQSRPWITHDGRRWLEAAVDGPTSRDPLDDLGYWSRDGRYVLLPHYRYATGAFGLLSCDGGITFTSVRGPWQRPGDDRGGSCRLRLLRPDGTLVAVRDDRVDISTNGGLTWFRIACGIPRTAFALPFDAGEIAWLQGPSAPMVRSWESPWNGPVEWIDELSVRFCAVPDGWLVFRDRNRPLLIIHHDGQTAEEVPEFLRNVLPNDSIMAIAAPAIDNPRRFVLTGRQGLLASRDTGRTWQALPGTSGATSRTSLAITCGKTPVLIAAAGDVITAIAVPP